MPIKDPKKRALYHKTYMRSVWYPANKVKHQKLIKRRKEEIVRFIRKYKTDRGCSVCGYNKSSEALEFDHVKGVKSFDLGSSKSKSCSIEKVLEEIAKCEIVCANCHRERTTKRRAH